MSDGHLQIKYDSDQENCKPPNGSLQYIYMPNHQIHIKTEANKSNGIFSL